MDTRGILVSVVVKKFLKFKLKNKLDKLGGKFYKMIEKRRKIIIRD